MFNAIVYTTLTSAGIAFGPALSAAFPIWGGFCDLMSSIPGMMDAWLQAASVVNNPAFDTLFEMIFS